MKNKNSIMSRMRQMIEIYKFVKFYNVTYKNLCKLEENVGAYETSIRLKVAPIVQTHYEENGKTLDEIHDIAQDAIRRGFLKTNNSLIIGDTSHYLRLTTEGRKLIDLPIGTLDVFLSEYKDSTVFVFGLASSGIAYGLYKAITVIVKKL